MKKKEVKMGIYILESIGLLIAIILLAIILKIAKNNNRITIASKTYN